MFDESLFQFKCHMDGCVMTLFFRNFARLGVSSFSTARKAMTSIDTITRVIPQVKEGRENFAHIDSEKREVLVRTVHQPSGRREDVRNVILYGERAWVIDGEGKFWGSFEKQIAGLVQFPNMDTIIVACCMSADIAKTLSHRFPRINIVGFVPPIVPGVRWRKAFVENGQLQTHKDGSYVAGDIERGDIVAFYKTFQLFGGEADEIILPVMTSKYIDPKSTCI